MSQQTVHFLPELNCLSKPNEKMRRLAEKSFAAKTAGQNPHSNNLRTRLLNDVGDTIQIPSLSGD